MLEHQLGVLATLVEQRGWRDNIWFTISRIGA